jgi:hypothetical protein
MIAIYLETLTDLEVSVVSEYKKEFSGIPVACTNKYTCDVCLHAVP